MFHYENTYYRWLWVCGIKYSNFLKKKKSLLFRGRCPCPSVPSLHSYTKWRWPEEQPRTWVVVAADGRGGVCAREVKRCAGSLAGQILHRRVEVGAETRRRLARRFERRAASGGLGRVRYCVLAATMVGRSKCSLCRACFRLEFSDLATSD